MPARGGHWRVLVPALDGTPPVLTPWAGPSGHSVTAGLRPCPAPDRCSPRPPGVRWD